MVDLVNSTRCGKVDKLKHRQRTQNNILPLFQKDFIKMWIFLKFHIGGNR